MDIEHKIRQEFRNVAVTFGDTSIQKGIEANIKTAAIKISNAFTHGNKVLICGNGGSAAEALHFGGELVGKFEKERRALSAIVLGSNPASLTAISNDYSYEREFSREVEAYGQTCDVLVALSTSGNSKNVIEAVRLANKKSISTIGFLGRGGILKDLVLVPLLVDSDSTPRIQEVHLFYVHIISELVEEILFGEGKWKI